MKLLVLAQTPPPHHGQSLMVRALLDGLPGCGIEAVHAPLNVSRDLADIGRWRPGKILAVFRSGFAARRLARRENCNALYYVPAPGKRGALWRDIALLALARPTCPRLVLHWHAVGLGAWLAQRATAAERRLAQRHLGRADLALVLAPELLADAAEFTPHRTAIVPNGLPDPGPPAARHRQPGSPCEILFLGLGSHEKGLHDTVEAVTQLHGRTPGAWRLTFAGGFATAEDERHFKLHAAAAGGAIRHTGFADDTGKRMLFAAADIFCFPTSYPHEGQPLTLIEALAHDVKIVTTRWRAIPGMLARDHVWFTAPKAPGALAATLEVARAAPPPCGALRRHFLAHFTREHHFAALRQALESLAG
jgi:glycosyltransferase involved in cell wall biosynthesis